MLPAFWLGTRADGASLQTFGPLFTQVTNEIAFIETHFTNSPAQKLKLAALVRSESAVLNPTLRDEQTLASLVMLLGGSADYDATLDDAAARARATVLGGYNVLALRVANLPPALRATRARGRFNGLAGDANALNNAQHAAAISTLLGPFGRRVELIARVVDGAMTLPVPVGVRVNGVRATVDGHAFFSAGSGLHSPNLFDVTAPGGLYYDVACRTVDGSRVINFALPVVTDQVRYEVGQGLAALTYTEDVFGTNAMAVAATNGVFYVQAGRNEIYGIFSSAGPGFVVKDGKFRIEIPRALRGQ